jgi:hypothetical protein
MNNWGLELPRKHALMDSHPGNERNDLEMLSTTPFGMRLSPTSQVQDVTYVSGLDIGGMAEREGFEPPIGLHLCRISSAVHSTTLPPLQAP